MFKSVLLSLFRKAFGPWVEPAPPRPKVPTRRLFSIRPRLEVLEAREMLDATTDTLIWNPQGGSSNASVGTNYYDATAKQQIQAGQLPNGPTATNPIQLDGSQAGYNVSIVFDKPLTVASLTVQNNYAKTITINNGDTLTSNGPVTINTGTAPTLISRDPTGILADDNGVAVSVQSGATLNLWDPAQATAGSSFFGKNVAGYLSNAGTVNWKGTA